MHAAAAVAACLIFVLSYLGIAAGRLPGTQLDRTGIAVVGAVLMLCTGLLSPAAAAKAVDLQTLAILGGLMLLSGLYERSGLYARITGRLAAMRSPRLLLTGTILTAAGLSALLTNDVVCVAITPVIAATALRRGWPVTPFLIAVAAASNIGGALTPIGNPQNILIAQSVQLRFADFALEAALPVAGSLIALTMLLRGKLPAQAGLPPAELAAASGPLAHGEKLAVLLSLLTVALLLSPMPPALAALAVGGLSLFDSTEPAADAIRRIDFPLLLLFSALFVLVAGFDAAGGTAAMAQLLRETGTSLSRHDALLTAAALLSNLVSNVPAVMLLLPLTPHTTDHAVTLALGSTLAGNAILLSSVANLIVVAQAERAGTRLTFADHARVGIPLTAISLGLVLLSRLIP